MERTALQQNGRDYHNDPYRSKAPDASTANQNTARRISSHHNKPSIQLKTMLKILLYIHST